MEWQPIETAPKNERIFVYGYQINGQAAPGGPYRYYFSTVGELNDFNECEDLLRPECCVVQGYVETPTHWMPRPDPPVSN